MKKEPTNVSNAEKPTQAPDIINNQPEDAGTSSPNSRRAPAREGIAKRFVWPFLKPCLYVLFLVAAVGLLFIGMEKAAEYVLGTTYLGHVYPSNSPMMRRDFTRPVSHYDYDFVPGVCLEYNMSKGNRYEYANNAGFREPRDIAKEKPQDEFRILLTGGSTTFGLGAVGEAAPAMGYYGLEYKETISHMMEMILNATAAIPGKTIRVYNAGVWGYSYQHTLMRYVTKLRQYNPDMVISLDGANELPIISKLHPDWNYFEEGQFHEILKDVYAYNSPGLRSYLTLWLKNNSYLMAYVWSGRDVFQELHKAAHLHKGGPDAKNINDGSLSETSLEEKSRLVDRNIAAVVKVVDDYHSALQNDGVAHIFALQPWFYSSKKTHHDKERILAGLDGYRHYYGISSDNMYRLLTNRIEQSAANRGYFLVNFLDYYDDVSEWVFTDWCHLTSGANYLLAKELSNLVKEHFLGRKLDKGDEIQDKDGVFWDLAAGGKIVSALREDGPENGPQNVLSGYPKDSLYSSVVASPGEEVEMILDLGMEHPLSRLRLVWGDEASVPKAWTVEASIDGKTWRPFVRGDGATDSYSRWPGFEYYASQPLEARYLKYRPESPGHRSIKLRQWSVYR
jgi:hypothetical protein